MCIPFHIRHAVILVILFVLSWPCQSRSYTASDTVQTRLAEGHSLYLEGHFSDAIERFQVALRVGASCDTARYWLGMCYLKQDRLKEAKKQFHRLTGVGSSYARGFDGLGLVLLKEKNRAFEALAAFQRATALDPTDAEAYYHTGLAYITLMTRGPVAEQPYADRAHQAFEKALGLNQQHPDAGYQLGRLYQGMAGGGGYEPNQTDSFYRIGMSVGASETNLDQAVLAYAWQIRTNPSHEEAIRALGILQSRRGHHETAQTLLQALVDYQHVPDPYLLIDLALAHWRAKVWQQAYETFDKLIPLLPENEQRLFKDLTLVAQQDEVEQYAQASAAVQDSLWQAFWASRDPVPLTRENEDMIEHYARVAYARHAFAGDQFPWDQRGGNEMSRH